MELSTVDTNKWSTLLSRETWKSEEPHNAAPCGDFEPEVRTIRQHQRRLTRAQVERLAARYAEGATVYELAEEFGCSRATVAERLKKAGVAMRCHAPTAKQVEEMVRLYQLGLSLAKVGDQLGFSANTVLAKIREMGVKTRDPQGQER